MSDQVKTKCWEEAPGETSAMRVGMLVAVFAGCGLGFLGLYRDANLIELTALVSAYLAAGFGGKVWQKGKEK